MSAVRPSQTKSARTHAAQTHDWSFQQMPLGTGAGKAKVAATWRGAEPSKGELRGQDHNKADLFHRARLSHDVRFQDHGLKLGSTTFAGGIVGKSPGRVPNSLRCAMDVLTRLPFIHSYPVSRRHGELLHNQ